MRASHHESVPELLRRTADQLQSGELRGNRAIVIIIDEAASDKFDYMVRAGDLSGREIQAYLSLASHSNARDMLG